MSTIDSRNMLKALHKAYDWDADTLRCRHCKRGIHFTRLGELLQHSADCPNQDNINPWLALLYCIQGEMK